MKHSSIQEKIKPFRARNVKLFLFGDIFLFLSFWLIQIDLSWILYQITKSSFQLGLLGFLVNVPMILLLPVGGVLADCYDRRRIILGCLIVWCIPTTVLIVYSRIANIHMALVLAAGVAYGTLFAIIKPPSDALIRNVVAHKKDIHRVIGIDGASNKIMQFLAAAVDAVLRILGGVIASFASSLGFSLLAFLCFFKIKPTAVGEPEKEMGTLAQLTRGFSHVFRHTPFWTTTLLSATALGISIALLFQLPVFASKVLGGDLNILHYLYFAGGIGGTAGGILLGTLLHSKGILKLTTYSLILMGVSLIVFAFSRWVFLSVIFMFLVDGCMIFTYASANAALQYIVEDSMRGRVMSIFGMVTIGSIPIFNLLMGVLGNLIGITYAVVLFGIFCIAISLAYLFIMPINRREIKSILRMLAMEDPESSNKLL